MKLDTFVFVRLYNSPNGWGNSDIGGGGGGYSDMDTLRTGTEQNIHFHVIFKYELHLHKIIFCKK